MRQLSKHASLGKSLADALDALRPRYSPTSVLAHELGHSKAFGKSGPKVQKVRQFLYRRGPMIGDIAASLVKADPGKFSKKRALVALAGNAPRLAEEFAASYYALKAMRGMSFISPSQYKQGRKNLVNAFGTYASMAGAKTLGAGASSIPAGLIENKAGDALAQYAVASLVGKSGKYPARHLARKLYRDMGKEHLSNAGRRRQIAKAMGRGDIPIVNARTFGSGPAHLGSRRLARGTFRRALGRKLDDKIHDKGMVLVNKEPKHRWTGKKSPYDILIDFLRKY